MIDECSVFSCSCMYKGKLAVSFLRECSCVFSVREILQGWSIMSAWVYEMAKNYTFCEFNDNIIVCWFKIHGRSQWPLACWDCGFESHRGHGCPSVMSAVCFQVEVSAKSWSLVQRSPTDCDTSSCVITKPQEWGDHGLCWATAPQGKKRKKTITYTPKQHEVQDVSHAITCLSNFWNWKSKSSCIISEIICNFSQNFKLVQIKMRMVICILIIKI